MVDKSNAPESRGRYLPKVLELSTQLGFVSFHLLIHFTPFNASSEIIFNA